MAPGAGVDLLNRITTLIIDPAIAVIFTAGLLLFLWGLIEFLWTLNQGGDRNKGVQHMLWGVVGMLIMVSVYGIVNLVVNTLGITVSGATDTSRIQNVPQFDFFN
ncbi:hypothetical protein COU20_01155 [Candidatus Kaiserbacteria bacterium CG10_big_fil_rev_8_21_14_0_10_59_10]|uniref:Uncharacterized protein n=1 Tax=Candidatus Kaiserbacteria bacterium CG10_big_fil_rev_8_21_14_0_10_59_10 TaxID=1974612 RepID=A0A2H0U898_9BACT|nr:MAG: hypothetical protein COU20_01155 [Candidatus Kaiserbacteria bacterium CG10_big_fil_rev_8_21_14_0_10_59_10]